MSQPYPGQHAQYTPAQAPKNGLGTAGFTLGLLGLLFSPIPIIGVIAWPMVILGLIFSIIGFNQAKRGEATNKGLSAAGIICSMLGLLLCIIWLAAIGNAANETQPTPVPPTGTWSAPYLDIPPPSAAPTPPAVPAAEAGPATTVSDGMYEVGVDLEAGRYKTTGPDQSSAFPFCYWARTSDDSGEFSAIIANQNLQGPGSVTVNDGEFVQFSGGCTWAMVS